VGQLRVSSKSNPNAVAGAFAGVIREQGRAEVCVIGAGALNQAIKAAAIARGYLAEQGIELVCVPSFCEVEIDGELRTGLQLIVEARDEGQIKALADGPREVRLDEHTPTTSI
jgi:stage V sporulation protein S